MSEGLHTNELPQRGCPAAPGSRLQAYLLGSTEFESVLTLQKRFVYQVSGTRDQAVLLLCEHLPIVTVGRQGSRAHLVCEQEELQSLRWRVRWVNRGNGCFLHVPGQLAVYPVLPLDRLGLGVADLVRLLHVVVCDVLADFGLRGEIRQQPAGVWVGDRPVALTGVAVRDWVSYFGTVLNLNPDLEHFKKVRCGGPGVDRMTSIDRERRHPMKPSMARQRFLEHFRDRFGFSDLSLFFHHPALDSRPSVDRIAAGF